MGDMLKAAIIALGMLWAAAAQAADLLQIYQQAQTQDAVYASARAGWQAAQEKLPQGRAALLPNIGLTADTEFNDRDIQFREPSPNSGTTHFNSNGIALQLTQPLFNMQAFALYDQAKTLVAQSDAQLVQAQENLITRVAQAYFDVLLAQDNVALAKANTAALGEQLAQAKRNYDVGTGTIVDVNDAQARSDLAHAQEISAQNDLEVKRRALQQITGKPAPELATLGPRFTVTLPQPANMDKWVDQAYTASPQVRTAELQLQFARQDIDRARSGHYPTLDAVASYGRTGVGSGAQGGVGNDTTNAIVGLQFAMPIFQGGLIRSQVREAVANEQKAQDDLENARRSTALATRQAFLGVTSGAAQVRALDAALKSSESSLQSNKLGQKVGVKTEIDVLNAQQQLFNTRTQLAQAKYSYITSLLSLKAAVGTLGKKDLVKINSWLVH
jgi:outer membrane protein